jgi:hypothetical protein
LVVHSTLQPIQPLIIIPHTYAAKYRDLEHIFKKHFSVIAAQSHIPVFFESNKVQEVGAGIRQKEAGNGTCTESG